MPYDRPTSLGRAICLLSIWVCLPAGADAPSPDTPPTHAAPSVALVGLVTDPDGDPVAGATVRVLPDGLSMWFRSRHVSDWVDPAIVTTDERGRFEVEGLSAERLTIRAEAPGHGSRTWDEASATDAAMLQLTPGRAIRGTVSEARSGDPVAGARIIFCDDGALPFGRDACRRVDSDEAGRFDAGVLSRGELVVGAVAPGRAYSLVRTVPTGDADVDGLAFRLEPGASVAGKVLDQKERPVEGARVRGVATEKRNLDRSRRTDAWPVHTDEKGRFVLEGLTAGRSFNIWAERLDRPPVSAGPFEIVAGADRDSVVIVMPESAEVVWRIVDPDDEPLVDLEVYLHRTDVESPIGFLSGPVPESMLDNPAPGSFRLLKRQPGEHELLIVPAGYAELRRSAVVLTAGEATDLGTLVATPGRELTGHISDPDGVPVKGATLHAWDGGLTTTASRQTTSDDDGHYAIGGLRESGVTLYVEAEGYFGSNHDVDAAEAVYDVTLDPAAGITGTVALDSTEQTVPDQFTILVHAEANTVASGGAVGVAKPQGFATPDGSFRMNELAPGTYTVEARAWGWGIERRGGVSVVARETTDIGTLTLPAGKTLRGRVISATDGAPVPGASVELHERRGWKLKDEYGMISMALSDDSGAYEIAGVVAGEYVLRGQHFAFASAEIDFRVEADSKLDEITLQLPRGGALTGTVRDANGQPLPRRNVVLAKTLTDLDIRHASSDAEGVYRIDRIPAGSYEARLLPAPDQGLKITTAAAVIHEDEVTVLDFDDEVGIRLYGVVLRSGEPVPRALLYFNPLDGALNLSELRGTTSDDAGRYQIELALPGVYRVMIQGGSTGGSSTEITVPDEPEVARDIVLELDGIAGRVVDDEGQPLRGASVSARPDGAVGQSLDNLLVSETDASGRYSIQGLEPGTYRVTAIAAGYRTGVAYPVETSGATVGGIDFELSRGNALRGVVVDADGRGIAGAYVLASPAGAGDPLNAASAETDINGAFRMTAPADGPLDLTAFPPDRAPVRRSSVAPPDPDDPVGLVLRASSGGSLRVHVVDASGSPVSGAYVSVAPVPAFVGSDIGRLLRPVPPTDASGQVLVRHVAPGDYAVSIAGHPDLPPARVTVSESVELPVKVQIP